MIFKVKHFLKEEEIKIEILKQWNKKDDVYYAPGALIKVNSGKGLLREVYGEVKDYNKAFNALMFGDRTLLQLQGDEYFCPTCEKILRSGYGMENSFYQDMQYINTDQNDFSLEKAIEYISPLLGLLKSDYYVILDTKLHPTDGNGNFFWNKQLDTPSLGSCLYYAGDGEWGKSRPYYTIATEPKEKFNKERVEYYIDKPNCRAIAYYMDGYMTALLDGHHKTFAAAIKHTDVNALVIIPGFLSHLYNSSRSNFELAYQMCEMKFTASDLGLSKKDINSLKNQHVNNKLTDEEAKEVWNEFYNYKSEFEFPFKTDELVKWYPSVDEQASIERAGTIDDEFLDKIVSRKINYSDKKVCILIQALCALKHDRLLEMVDYFCKQNIDGSSLYKIFESLIKLPRTNQMEHYLIDKMVDLEMDYPTVGKLILENL